MVGVEVHGADFTVPATASAGYFFGETAPEGRSGVFAVQSTSLVRASRCDWPNCTAYFEATPTVAAEWHPF